MANLHLIKILAEKKNITITELANMTGITEQQIHLIARTNSTKIQTLEKIARALDVPVTIFFDNAAGSVHTEGKNSPAPYYGNPQVVSDTKYLESLLEEKDKRIHLLETILKNNNLL